jgi:hypothetical protein
VGPKRTQCKTLESTAGCIKITRGNGPSPFGNSSAPWIIAVCSLGMTSLLNIRTTERAATECRSAHDNEATTDIRERMLVVHLRGRTCRPHAEGRTCKALRQKTLFTASPLSKLKSTCPFLAVGGHSVPPRSVALKARFSGDCAVRSRLPRLMTFLAVLLHAGAIDPHALPNIFFTGKA